MRLKDLYDRGSRIWVSLPEEERDSFFQLFLMKLHVSFWCNAEYYFADRSRLSYNRGLGTAADRYLDYARVMMDGRRQMLHYYNYIMCGGKWSRILTPEAFPPPGIPLYPAGKPALTIEKNPRMSVVTWDGSRIGETGELTFYPGGIQKKWIEIGNLGGGELEYEIRGLEGSGIAFSCPEGKVTTLLRFSGGGRRGGDNRQPVQPGGKCRDHTRAGAHVRGRRDGGAGERRKGGAGI